MIVSSELNDIEGIRDAAKNTFFTMWIAIYLNENEIKKII